jgi:hypothetical protein
MEQLLQPPEAGNAHKRFPLFSLAWAFMFLWWFLGAVLLGPSILIVVEALRSAPYTTLTLSVLAGIEAVSALFFMLPRAQRLGAAGLLITMLVVFVIHAAHHQYQWELFLYSAAVLFVAVHGPMSREQLEGRR